MFTVSCFNEFYFFFQAEDGIRDYKVTGVQTCALPISRARAGDGARTRDPQLGRLMLYQLSYARAPSGGGRIRTFVGCRRQIYSLLPLATRAPHRAGSARTPPRHSLAPVTTHPAFATARGVCIPPSSTRVGAVCCSSSAT